MLISELFLKLDLHEIMIIATGVPLQCVLFLKNVDI